MSKTKIMNNFFLDAGPAPEGGCVPCSDGNILLIAETNKQTPGRKSNYSY